MDLCSYWLFVEFTFRCCQSWTNVVDDRIEGRSLEKLRSGGSWSCGAFVRRNNGSEGYDDPGGHRFVVHGLYRRCTVLKTSRGVRRAHVFARTAAATGRSGESSGCGPVQRGRPCGRRADRWKAACATEAVSQAHAQEQTLLVACLQLSVHRLEAGGAGPAWPMQQTRGALTHESRHNSFPCLVLSVRSGAASSDVSFVFDMEYF